MCVSELSISEQRQNICSIRELGIEIKQLFDIILIEKAFSIICEISEFFLPVYHFYAEIGNSSTVSLHWWTMWTIQSLKNSVKVQSIESAGKVLKAIPGGIMYAALRGHPTNALALTNN